MDTGNGAFRKVKEKEVKTIPEEQRKNMFYVGELLTIKESRFRVQRIQRKKMTLERLPKN